MSNEVDFLHVDEHESLLQIDRVILMGMLKHSQNSQNGKFVMSLQYLRQEVRDEFDFLHVDKHHSFLQVDFNTLGVKVSFKMILSLLMGMIKQIKQIVKVLKKVSQSISKHQSVSKKKLGMD